MPIKGPKPVFIWQGDAFVPEERFRWQCDQDYTVGEKYRLEVIADRSAASHSHYFAAINEAWLNLPESRAKQFPSPEHLRKWALIQCGFCHTDHRVFSTKQDALTAATMLRGANKYAVISVHDNILEVYTAESQSHKEMGGKRFQVSKSKVLDLLAGMINVTPKQLETHANGA